MLREWVKQELLLKLALVNMGLPTATVCALFGLPCNIYMGSKDIERQKPNVFRMKLLGANIIPVESGSKSLKDAMNEAYEIGLKTYEILFILLVQLLVLTHTLKWFETFNQLLEKKLVSKF